MYKFEKLTVWQETLVLCKICYQVARSLPVYEIHGLSDQLRRAVTSVLLNIAEGSGSESDKEFQRYLYIARKSLFETIALLKFIQIEYKLDYLDNVFLKCTTVGKLLNGFIKKLKAQS